MFLGCQIGPSKKFLKFKVCLGSSKFKIDFFSSCNLKRKKKLILVSLPKSPLMISKLNFERKHTCGRMFDKKNAKSKGVTI